MNRLDLQFRPVRTRRSFPDDVRLSTFASLKTTTEPRELKRFQQLNAVRIQGVIPPPVSLDRALTFLEDEARRILPPGFTIDYAGESRPLRTEGSKFMATFLLSAILIYLVLAAQFESFRDPFIILAGSVPLAISGALVFFPSSASPRSTSTARWASSLSWVSSPRTAS